MTEGDDTFDVVVTGFEPGGDPPAVRLERVFGLRNDAAERLLARLPAPVQRAVPRIRAEYFRRALLKIGAHVEVRDDNGAPVELLPSVPPPAPRRVSEAPSHGAPLPVSAPAAAPLPLEDAPPLAASLRPESLSPAEVVKPLIFETSDDVLSLDAPNAAPAGTPSFGPSGATADTLFDSRQRASATAQAPVPEPLAFAQVPGLDNDTVGHAVRMPANPTLPHGSKALSSAAAAQVVAQGPTLAAVGAPHTRANATVFEGQKVAGPALSGSLERAAFGAAVPAQAPLVFGDLAAPLAAAQPGFSPPALELGLDGADMMSKLPSSIWDAPPPAHPQPDAAPIPAAERLPGHELQLSGASASSLDLDQPISFHGALDAPDAPLDLPSVPVPGAGGRAPLPLARPSGARERPPRAQAPQAVPRERARPAKGSRPKAKPATPAHSRASESFWELLPQAFTLPFSGTGLSWMGLIALWSLLAAILSAGAMLFVPAGVVVAFASFTLVLACACDYFRACFWQADAGSPPLERAPSLQPARLLHNDLKSGAQLTVFALVTGLPLIFVTIAGMGDGATPLDLFREPSTWLLAFVPALLWPGAVAMSALHNRFEAIWYVSRAVSIALRAPREYLATAFIGAVIFSLGLWLLLALASAAGLSGILLSAALGLPMALSHGVQGALMGQLMRARPELFSAEAS